MVSRRDALKMGAGAAGSAVAGGAAFLLREKDQGESQISPPGTSHPGAEGDTNSPTTPPGYEQTEIATEVGEDGFDLVFGAVRVMAPAGVAPVGTEISVSASARPALHELEDYSNAMGDTINIVLGENRQPEQPITISFRITPTELAADVSDEFPLIVITTSDHEDVPGYLHGTWDADSSTLTVVTDHLSLFGWIQFDLGRWISDFFARLLGMTFSKPTCAYRPRKVGETTYRIDAIDDDAVWPCIQQSRGQIVVELHSNSVLPWAVRSAPSTQGTVSGNWKDVSPGLASVYQRLYAVLGDERTAVMPGNTASLRYHASAPPEVIGLKVDPGLFLVSTLVYAVQSSLTIFFRGNPISNELLDGFEGLDCILEIQNTFYEFEDEGSLTGVVKSALSCILAMMADNVKDMSWGFISRAIMTVVNLLIGGASLFAAGLLGAYRTLTSNDELTFVVSTDGVPSTAVMETHGPRLDIPIVVKWQSEWIGQTLDAPVYIDGAIFSGSQNLTKLDAETGHTLWQFPTSHDQTSRPTFSNGRVFVSSLDRTGGSVQAVDASSGWELWRFEAEGAVPTRPGMIDDLVVVGASDGSIHALTDATGEERWRLSADIGFMSHPVTGNGQIYGGDDRGVFHAVDAASGQEAWHYGAGGPVVNQVVVRHTAYLGIQGQGLTCLDALSGVEQWRSSLNIERFPMISANERIVCVDTGPTLTALDTASGQVLWQFSSGVDRIYRHLAVAGDVVYVSSSSHLYAIASDSGEELWRHALYDSNMTVAPYFEVANGTIYILDSVDNRGHLFAFGNLMPARLAEGVTVRAAPSSSAFEHGTAKAGAQISSVGERVTSGGEVWFRVTIGNLSGWIPLDAIDPATLPPEGEIEYVYIPK